MVTEDKAAIFARRLDTTAQVGETDGYMNGILTGIVILLTILGIIIIGGPSMQPEG
jgi:hypothetical protein